MKRYLRFTHDADGKYRGPFSAEADRVFHDTPAGFIIHLMNPETPMSALDLYCAVLEYDKGFPEEGPSCLSVEDIQQCLDNLVKHDMAKEVREVIWM